MQKVILALALISAVAFAWPTIIGGCGSPEFYDSFNGTANGLGTDGHTSEFLNNGSWALQGVPASWTTNTKYVITINGTNAGLNGTKNTRVRGWLIAAYDNTNTSFGSWSDSADFVGYTQTVTCGTGPVVAGTSWNHTKGTPSWYLAGGKEIIILRTFYNRFSDFIFRTSRQSQWKIRCGESLSSSYSHLDFPCDSHESHIRWSHRIVKFLRFFF